MSALTNEPAAKTEEQIRAEIAALQEVKAKLPEYAPLGEPIHGAIDAQIKALETGVFVEYADDFIYNCVSDALDWRCGDGDAPDSVAGLWRDFLLN
jgi:hypothetical protein